MTTSRTLIIMRHAEAEAAPGLPDKQRPLTPKGATDAVAAAASIVAAGLTPDRGITSSAQRTLETATALRKAFAAGTTWDEPRDDLYLSGLDVISRVLREPECEDARTVLVLGHNPGFSAAVTHLVGAMTPLGTSEAAVVATDAATWDEALDKIGSWRLVRVVKP